MPEFELRQTAILPANPPPIVSIGLGGIVHDAHYPAYAIAGFDVIGGFDINAERAAMMREKFAIPRLYDSLAQTIDLAPRNAVFDIAVPGSAIADILREIPSGRAVLIQKPMGEDLAEARRILSICREKKLVAAINFQLRYAPFIIAARDMIERGLHWGAVRYGGPRSVQYALASMAIPLPLAPGRDSLSQHSLRRPRAFLLRHAPGRLRQDGEPPQRAPTCAAERAP